MITWFLGVTESTPHPTLQKLSLHSYQSSRRTIKSHRPYQSVLGSNIYWTCCVQPKCVYNRQQCVQTLGQQQHFCVTVNLHKNDLQNANTSAVTTLDDRNVGCFFLDKLKSCFETVPNDICSLRVTKFVDSMYSELIMSLPPYRSRSVYL